MKLRAQRRISWLRRELKQKQRLRRELKLEQSSRQGFDAS
jgi:hypothetical protein